MLDICRIERPAGDVIVLGTRVVTPEAIAELRVAIAEAGAAHVVLDYDATRWRWLGMLAGDGKVDLVDVIRSGEMAELNARLAMGVLGKFVAPRAGVAQDAEFVAAHAAAEELGARVSFGRRPVEVEGVRAWRRCDLGERSGFAWSLLKGSLKRTELGEPAAAAGAFDADLAHADGVRCAGGASRVLFDEATEWLVAAVQRLEGNVVVVTRAGELARFQAAFEVEPDIEGLDVVPPKSLFSRAIPWVFTVLIIAAFVLGFVYADPEKMQQAAVAWFASNMSFAALGAALALAHPVTIIATSISAPFVSLNPAIGAGMVGALVQAFVAPPTVQDMDRVGDDITRLSGWWRNRLARLVLIFVFGNVFSSIGSFAAFAWFPT